MSNCVFSRTNRQCRKRADLWKQCSTTVPTAVCVVMLHALTAKCRFQRACFKKFQHWKSATRGSKSTPTSWGLLELTGQGFPRSECWSMA